MSDMMNINYLRKGMDCTENEIKVKDGNKEFVAFEVKENSEIKIKVEKNSNLLLTGITKSKVEKLKFDIDLKENSKLVFTFNLGSISEKSKLKIKIKSNKNSVFVLNNLIDVMGKVDFNVEGKIKENCESKINTLISTGSRDVNSKIKINIEHKGSNSKNEINLAGVINSKSKCDFEGEIYIPENLEDVNSSMQAKFLCYDGAEVNTLPVLKIESKHVKTSHGISVINVDPKQVEYLMSRGLNEREANEVLKVGSLAGMLDKMASSFKKAGVKL